MALVIDGKSYEAEVRTENGRSVVGNQDGIPYFGNVSMVNNVFYPHGQGTLASGIECWTGHFKYGVFTKGTYSMYAVRKYVYDGVFEDGQMIEGNVYINDHLSASGQFKNLNLVDGTRYYPEGHYFTGTFEENRKKGTFYSECGKIMARGEFAGFLCHDSCTLYKDGLPFMTGTFDEGQMKDVSLMDKSMKLSQKDLKTYLKTEWYQGEVVMDKNRLYRNEPGRYAMDVPLRDNEFGHLGSEYSEINCSTPPFHPQTFEKVFEHGHFVGHRTRGGYYGKLVLSAYELCGRFTKHLLPDGEIKHTYMGMTNRVNYVQGVPRESGEFYTFEIKLEWPNYPHKYFIL